MKPIFHVRRVLLVGLVGLLASLPASGAAQQQTKKPAQKPFTLMLTTVKVKATKLDGSPWDGEGNPPDLVVRILLTDAARHKQLEALLSERRSLENRLSDLDKLKQDEARLKVMNLKDPQRPTLQANIQAMRQTVRPLNALETARLPALRPLIEQLYRDLFIDTPIVPDTLEATFDKGSLGVAVGDELTISVTDYDYFWFRRHDAVGTLKHKLTAEQLKQEVIDLTFDQVLSLKLAVKPNR